MAKRHSKGGGGILSAGRGDEAAREYLITATSELVEHLLFIRNHKDDPGLSAINNQRRRYARILFAMDGYFHKIGHDKVHELGTYIASLGVALQDLIEGVTDPLFVTKGSKRDSMRIWGAPPGGTPRVTCSKRRRDSTPTATAVAGGPNKVTSKSL